MKKKDYTYYYIYKTLTGYFVSDYRISDYCLPSYCCCVNFGTFDEIELRATGKPKSSSMEFPV